MADDTGLADDTMTRDEESERIGSYRCANGSSGFGLLDGLGQLTVGNESAWREC